MKRSIIFCVLITLLVVSSCTKETDGNSVNISRTPVFESITFSNGGDGVTVLAFREDGGEYFYEKTIAGNWSGEGRLTAPLEIGKYKFLFSKFAKVNSSFSPSSFSFGNTKFEDIAIYAVNDSKSGYVKGVDEIWLPEAEEAKKTVHITGNDTVRAILKRVVSQPIIIVKRGYKNNNGDFVSIPYTSGESIEDDIESIAIDISNIGNKLTLEGNGGSVHTSYVMTAADSIAVEGDAYYSGPFVIPNNDKSESEIDITIQPVTNSKFPVMNTKVTGVFEKNSRLEITLWVTAIYEFITVTVDTKKISAEGDGDEGIWY